MGLSTTYTKTETDFLIQQLEEKTSDKYNDESNSIANDIIKRVNIADGVDVNYRETTTWYDGSLMNDSKVDGVIFIKKGAKYYKKQIDKQILLKINTIADLRNFNGYYEGQEVTLMGYYESGDKDPLTYKWSLTQGIDDGGSIINSGNGSWNVISSESLDVIDFGALPNNGEDVTSIIQKAIDFCASEKIKLTINKSGEYLIKGHVDGYTGNFLRDKGGLKLQTNTYLSMGVGVNLKAIPNNEMAYQILRIYDVQNITVDGGNLIGERYQHTGTTGEWGYGISIQGSSNIKISNVSIYDMFGDGINLQALDSSNVVPINVIIDNCICSNNRRQGISIEGGEFLRFTNCVFEKTNGTAPTCGVDIEPWNNLNIVRDVVFDGCTFRDNAMAGLLIMRDSVSNIKVVNCTFSDNTDTEGQLKLYSNVKDIIITNNVFNNSNINTNNLAGVSLVNGENIICDNNIFNGCISKVNRLSDNTNSNIVFSNNRVTFEIEPYESFYISSGGGEVDLKFQNNIYKINNHVSGGRAVVSLKGLKKGSIISNNTVYGGIRSYILDSSGTKFFGNISYNATIEGIIIYGDNNIIENNKIQGSCVLNPGAYSVSLYGNKNIIKNNIIIKEPINTSETGRAGIGIYILNNAEYNKVYENIIDDAIYSKIYYSGISDTNYIKNNGVLLNYKRVAYLNDLFLNGSVLEQCIVATKFDSSGMIVNDAVFQPLLKQSLNVTNISTADATDLATALTLVNELKAKLNAKLTADRNSGQQAT